MSMESADPKLYKRIREASDAEKKSLSETLNLHRLRRAKFELACSCSDCLRKLKTLQDFEINIIFLGHLNSHHIGKLQNKESLLNSLSYTARITKWILALMHKYLKTVCKDGGLLSTPPKSEATSKVEIVDQQINRLLISVDLKDDPPEERDDNDDDAHESDFSSNIKCLMYWYGLTKANKEAEPLLKEILVTEQKNEVERQKNTPDFSVIKENIERQIEKMEMIPFEVLEQEVKELLELISPIRDHYINFQKVRKYVSDVDAAMKMERDKFWANNAKLVKGHTSNGLDKTLDSLIEKVDLFNKEWEKEFGPFFTKYAGRLETKR